MIVDRNGVKYVRIGRTEFLESAVSGKSLVKLQKMFTGMNPQIVELLSEEVSPKTDQEPKSKGNKK